MKKLSLLISVFMLTAATVFAQTWEIGYPNPADVTATFNEGTLTISGKGAMKDFKYESDVPWYNNGIYDLVIKEGVTTIGEKTFVGCVGLTSISLPESLASIGNSAFSLCLGLTGTLSISEGIKIIGEKAFGNCIGLSSIVLPESLVSIGNHAFEECKGISAINVHPDNVNLSSIDGIVYDKTQTTVILCPEGKTGAVTIPEGVTAIEDYAFFRCDSLSSITLPESLASIGNYAFGVCFGLNSITLPENLTTIGNFAFTVCYGLSGTLIIPEGVTTIGKYAFYYCPGLSSINLPESLASIGEYAFAGCEGLSAINVHPGNANLSSIDGIVYDKAQTTAIQCPEGKTGAVTIPEGVKTIGEFAFAECKGISSINLPESLTTIGIGAFYRCEGLNGTLTIPVGIKTIGRGAFSFCKGISSIILSENLKVIGESAFVYCYGLNSITDLADEPQNITDLDVFSYLTLSNITLYVPEASLDKYREADVWKEFKIEAVAGIQSLFANEAVAVGFYSLSGIKLPKEPESGIYIVVYDNGKRIVSFK